jgi:hypothetical protein
MKRSRVILLSAVLVSATPAWAATSAGPGHCPGSATVRVEVPVGPLPGFTAEVRVAFGGRVHHAVPRHRLDTRILPYNFV